MEENVYLPFYREKGKGISCICSSNVPLIQFHMMLYEGRETETFSGKDWMKWIFSSVEKIILIKKKKKKVHFLAGFGKSLGKNRTSP